MGYDDDDLSYDDHHRMHDQVTDPKDCSKFVVKLPLSIINVPICSISTMQIQRVNICMLLEWRLVGTTMG